MDQADSREQEKSAADGLLRYLGILLRYRWFVIITTVLAAAAVLTFSIISLRMPPEESPLPNVFEASATLLLAEEATGGMSSVLEALGLTPPPANSAHTGPLVLQVLRSRAFTDTIIERNDMVNHYNMHHLSRDRRRALVAGTMGINYDARTRLLSISYRDIRPAFAQQVTNSIVAELEAYFRERGGLTRGRTIDALAETLTQVEAEVAAIEEEIRAFQRRYGVLSVAELAESQSAMLRDLERELVTLEREIRVYSERTRIENDPELIRLRSERNTVAALIRDIEAGYAGGVRTLPARAELPELALQLGRLQTDLAIQQRIRTSLQEQYEIARLMAETGAGFTVLELAELPDEKIGPSRGQLSVRVTIGAFIASVVLAFVHYGLKTVLKDPRVVGVIKENVSRPKKEKT